MVTAASHERVPHPPPHAPALLNDICCDRVASITVTRAGAQPSYPRESNLPPELQLPLRR